MLSLKNFNMLLAFVHLTTKHPLFSKPFRFSQLLNGGLAKSCLSHKSFILCTFLQILFFHSCLQPLAEELAVTEQRPEPRPATRQLKNRPQGVLCAAAPGRQAPPSTAAPPTPFPSAPSASSAEPALRLRSAHGRPFWARAGETRTRRRQRQVTGQR